MGRKKGVGEGAVRAVGVGLLWDGGMVWDFVIKLVLEHPGESRRNNWTEDYETGCDAA